MWPASSKVVAVHGGDDDGRGALGADLGDEVGHDLGVAGKAVLDLLVVVGELDEEEVAGLDEGHDLGEALFAEEGDGRIRRTRRGWR